MTTDLLDALTVVWIVTVFACLFSPALVWLLSTHE